MGRKVDVVVSGRLDAQNVIENRWILALQQS